MLKCTLQPMVASLSLRDTDADRPREPKTLLNEFANDVLRYHNVYRNKHGSVIIIIIIIIIIYISITSQSRNLRTCPVKWNPPRVTSKIVRSHHTSIIIIIIIRT